MAADPIPTLNSLVNEGLEKAGENLSNGTMLTRAREKWMPEIKDDIFTDSKKLKSLHSTAILVLTPGLSRYSRPTDFSSDLAMQLLTGNITGTAATGTISSITLANATDANVGDSVLITSNTAKANMSQITAINATTKVADVSPNFNTAPDSTSTYRIITKLTPIKQKPLWFLRNHPYDITASDPRWFFPIGDEDDEEFELYPIPGTAYGLQLTYYLDLTEIDITSTLMSTLYKRWRNVFVQGIYSRALDNIDSKKAPAQNTKYQRMLSQLRSREQYGMDLSNLQTTLAGDYDGYNY